MLLGGQTALVEGKQVNAIQAVNDTASNAGNAGAAPTISIEDNNGNDITSQVTSGSLAGLLNVSNTLLPSLIGGGQQVGGLNTLAQGLADSVNNVLAQGSTTRTPPYQAGSALFTYNASRARGRRHTFAVSSAITGSQLAAGDPGPPVHRQWHRAHAGGFGFRRARAGERSRIHAVFRLAHLGGRLRREQRQHRGFRAIATRRASQEFAAAGAGVSLDQEAIQLVQFQSSYQAASKVVTVIDDTRRRS